MVDANLLVEAVQSLVGVKVPTLGVPTTPPSATVVVSAVLVLSTRAVVCSVSWPLLRNVTICSLLMRKHLPSARWVESAHDEPIQKSTLPLGVNWRLPRPLDSSVTKMKTGVSQSQFALLKKRSTWK